MARSVLEGSPRPFVKLPVSDKPWRAGVDREAIATDLCSRDGTVPEADLTHIVVRSTIGVISPARISEGEVLVLTNGSELEVLLLLVQLTIDIDGERTISADKSHVIPLVGFGLDRSRYTIMTIDLELEDIAFPTTEDEA